jgi:hypothetical protein
MFVPPVARGIVQRRRRRLAAKGAVVADIMRWTVPALISSLWNNLEEDKLCL